MRPLTKVSLPRAFSSFVELPLDPRMESIFSANIRFISSVMLFRTSEIVPDDAWDAGVPGAIVLWGKGTRRGIAMSASLNVPR